MTRVAAGLLALVVAGAPALAQGQGDAPRAAPPAAPGGRPAAAPAVTTTLRIGYVELADDPRYSDERAYARIELRPLGRPFAGVEVALGESAAISRVTRIGFAAERKAGASVEELVGVVRGWAADEDIHFVVTDLPGSALKQLSDGVKDLPVLLLNATAPDDGLRGKDCAANMLHVVPSRAMLADALMQYLTLKKWTKILVLQGGMPEDALDVEALKRSAGRFGGRVVDVKPFELTNDPRQREQSNVALLTARADYDVVYVADNDGEYGRYVPYETQQPRPVVGSVGLVADAWHWAWERNGGPQLTSRFEKQAGRRPTGWDWSAWAAVKAVVQSSIRTKSADFAANRDFMFSDKMNLDGVKGNPMSVRSWDHQLRQPLFVATHNAVIERAPIRGFLHKTNELDTLGLDEPETSCRF